LDIHLLNVSKAYKTLNLKENNLNYAKRYTGRFVSDITPQTGIHAVII